MNELIEFALEWAKQGVPVFPTGKDKRPLTKNGHKDGSTDPKRVREMYEATGGRAYGIGAAMGEKCGMFAIDADIYKPGAAGESAKAYIASLEARGLLPETRRHKTVSGGVHYILFSEVAWPNCVPADGVEVKGEGGYIIVPMTPGYTVEHEGLAYAPAGLIAELQRGKEIASTRTIGELKQLILSGTSFHEAVASMSAKLGAQGWEAERIQNEVLNTLTASVARNPSHARHSRWAALMEDRSGELSRMIGSGYEKFNPNASTQALAELARAKGLFEPSEIAKTKLEGLDAPQISPQEQLEQAPSDWPFPDGYFGYEFPDVLNQKYVVHPILVEEEVTLISAEPKAGKTLFAQTLGMHIAAGSDLGNLVISESRPVLYFALESQVAIRRRLAAWKSVVDPRNSLLTNKTFPFFVSERAVNLLEEANRIELAVKIVSADNQLQGQGFAPVGAIIFDTLTKAMPGGDQNSVEDTSAVFDVIQKIRQLGCKSPIIFIHHDNKAGQGPRGSGNIQAEPDTLLGVTQDSETGDITVSVRMARSIEDHHSYIFSKEGVTLGTSEQGFEIKAPVLVPEILRSSDSSRSLVNVTREDAVLREITSLGTRVHAFRKVHVHLKSIDKDKFYPVKHKRIDSKELVEYFERLIPATGRLANGYSITMQTNRSAQTGAILIVSLTVRKVSGTEPPGPQHSEPEISE